MINGIALPMQMGQMTSAKGMSNISSEANHGKFGSVLASMTTSDSMNSQFEGKFGDVIEALTELLDMTTLEEVIGFLEEEGQTDLVVPEVIDGHFIIHDEKLIDLLEAVIPNLAELNELGHVDGNILSIDVRALLLQLDAEEEPLLNKLNELLLQVEGQQTGETDLDNLSKNDLMTLITVMKMVSIEGPKTDLTAKEESQLHSIQEVLKSLGEFLATNRSQVQQTQQNRPVMQPFMEVHATVQVTENLGQSAQTMSTEVKIDGAPPVQESQGNHRAEQLMRELQNVFKRANFGQTGGTNRISIKLYPEHLGQLRIELLQTNGLLTARILASNVLGKEMLESQLHQLRQAFLQQNIQVERIDISQMLTETPQHEREQAFNQQFKNEQENLNDQENQQDEEEPMSFSEYMIELEA